MLLFPPKITKCEATAPGQQDLQQSKTNLNETERLSSTHIPNRRSAPNEEKHSQSDLPLLSHLRVRKEIKRESYLAIFPIVFSLAHQVAIQVLLFAFLVVFNLI